jgi:hypothetical protein
MKYHSLSRHFVTTAKDGFVSLALWTHKERPALYADHGILMLRLFLNNGQR